MVGLNIGIDLGSSSTVIVNEKKGIILDEPTVIALDCETRYPVAFGSNAYSILGRTEENIEIIHPVVNGVISNYKTAQMLLKYYISKICGNMIFKPNVVITVPSAATNLDRRTLVDVLTSSGAGKVCLFEESLASAIGLGFDRHAMTGRLLVNMGGGSVDVSVITMGSIAVADTLKIGGAYIDESIQRYLKKTRDIMIGPLTAERLKICLGSAIPREEELAMLVSGKSGIDNMPISFEVTSAEIYECIQEVVEMIIKGIKEVLEKTPPELIGDISENGITLTGGTSQLYGMDKLLQRETGIVTRVSKDPLYSTASGATKVIKNLKLFADGYDFKTIHRID